MKKLKLLFCLIPTLFSSCAINKHKEEYRLWCNEIHQCENIVEEFKVYTYEEPKEYEIFYEATRRIDEYKVRIQEVVSRYEKDNVIEWKFVKGLKSENI